MTPSLAVAGEIDAYGQILSDQTGGVLVGASLPGAVRIAEVHGHAGRLGELTVIDHFLALIVGQTEAKRLRNPLEFIGESLQDVRGRGRFGVRQLDQDQQPAGAFHQGTPGAGIAFALDQVTLPVPRKLALLNLRWAQVDTELIGDVAASILAFTARDAFIWSLSQTGHQLLVQFAHRLGVDAAVHGFSGHAIGMAFGMNARHGQRDLLR